MNDKSTVLTSYPVIEGARARLSALRKKLAHAQLQQQQQQQQPSSASTKRNSSNSSGLAPRPASISSTGHAG